MNYALSTFVRPDGLVFKGTGTKLSVYTGFASELPVTVETVKENVTTMNIRRLALSWVW
jgi:hypothetical protein